MAHHLHYRIEIILDDIVLAFIDICDLGRYDTLAHFVHIVRSYHQRVDDIRNRVINTRHQLLPAADKFCSVSALLKLTICRRLNYFIRFDRGA